MIRILFIMLMLAAVIGFSRAHAASTNQQALSVEVFTTADREVQWELEVETRATRILIFRSMRWTAFSSLKHNSPATFPPIRISPNRSLYNASSSWTNRRWQRFKCSCRSGKGDAIRCRSLSRHRVFDGEAVVYGLTDLSSALDHYRTWRAEVGHEVHATTVSCWRPTLLPVTGNTGTITTPGIVAKTTAAASPACAGCRSGCASGCAVPGPAAGSEPRSR